jgi:hypothetical protein
LALWAWIITTGLTLSGIVAIVLAYVYGWNGVYLLIAPLLIGAGVTTSAILAGLRSPWAVLGLFLGIEVLFIVFRYVNLFGIGAYV